MVFDAAYQVACQFAVKEPHGQPHQLGEEIRDERHVDARTDVEQYTAPDHLNKCAAEYQHELCDQMSCINSDSCALCLGLQWFV